MNRIFTLFMLCGTLLLGGGCTKEDLSDCHTKVHLNLSYTHNEDNEDRLDELATCGELFLYDAAGTLLEQRALSASEIESGVVNLSVAQAAGEYSAVVWINASGSGDYAFSGEETMPTMRLEVLHENGQVGKPLPNWRPLGELMHGVHKFTTDGKRTPIEGAVSLRKLTNHVNIVLEGAVSGTYANGNPTSYSIQLTGSNGAYGCHADKLSCQRLNYAANYFTDVPDMGTNALVGEFHTLHLTPGDDMRLTVFIGTSTLYDEPLTELLRKAYEAPGGNPSGDTFAEWLWRHDEYILKFDSNMMLTAIKVLDWVSVEDIGGI